MVYLITDGKYTKIGKADGGLKGVEKRMSFLQTGNPMKLSIIKAFKGSYLLESLLHKSFVNYKIRGEWFLINFDIDEEIIECLEYLQDVQDDLDFKETKNNSVVKSENMQIIKDTIERMEKNNDYISKRLIAKTTGLSLSTVKSHCVEMGFKNKTTYNQKIKQRNLERIKKAVRSLKKEKRKLTYLNISEKTGISRSTVSKSVLENNLILSIYMFLFIYLL